MLRSKRLLRWLIAPAALLGVTVMMIDTVDARGGRGGSFGSRGAKTYTPPAPTATAPTAAPVTKSMTQPGAATAAAAKAGTTAASASRFGMGNMFRGLLLGGLMAGLFGSIFGFGALASMLGFLVQTALLVMVAMFVMNWFRNRKAAAAGASPMQRNTTPSPQSPSGGGYQAAAAGAGATAAAAASTGAPGELKLDGADFDAFERMLTDVQIAYSKRDIKTIERTTTPEMQSYFAQELKNDDDSGVINEVSNVKLLKGDLSEAWREQSGEYATVAMHYSLSDAVIDKATGRVVEGSRTATDEVTELWTFRRPVRGTTDQWELSAIQQG